VAPEPTKITLSSGPAFTELRTAVRACSRKRVVCRPLADASVWVLAYSGITERRRKSSMKLRQRPDAV
jgi:hypothetical protein